MPTCIAESFISVFVEPQPCASRQEAANASLAERVDGERHRHQADIEPHTLTSDVASIQTDGQTAGACGNYLSEPGQTGKDAPTKIVARRIPAESTDVGRCERARADGTHLATQDVQELRQFVESGRAKDLADARDTVTPHGAELEHVERPPGPADPLLAKENRPAIFQQNRSRDRRHHRRKRDQSAGGADDIEQSL